MIPYYHLKPSQKKVELWNLFRSGECGVVRAGAVFGGRRAAGDLVGVRQRPAVHLGPQALLVEPRLQEARVAVELHQVEDLMQERARERERQTERDTV